MSIDFHHDFFPSCSRRIFFPARKSVQIVRKKNAGALIYKVELSPLAVEDLKEIKEYIECELQNPIAAKNTVLKIIEIYEALGNSPTS